MHPGLALHRSQSLLRSMLRLAIVPSEGEGEADSVPRHRRRCRSTIAGPKINSAVGGAGFGPCAFILIKHPRACVETLSLDWAGWGCFANRSFGAHSRLQVRLGLGLVRFTGWSLMRLLPRLVRA